MDTRIRFFGPVLLLIVLFSVVKYRLLIETTTEAAEERMAYAVPQLQRYLLPMLTAAADEALVQHRLDAEAGANPDLAGIHWHWGAHTVKASNSRPPQVQHPAWFASWVNLPPHAVRYLVPHAHAGAADGELVVFTSPVHTRNEIWRTVQAQLCTSALIIFAVLFIPALIMRANSNMVGRLHQAIQRFRAGDRDARMALTGPLEARSFAQIFNDTAAEVQHLLHTLELTQHALQGEKERAEVTLSSIGDAVVTTDLAGNILTLNAVAQQLTGWSEDQARGRPLPAVFELQAEHGYSGPADVAALLQVDTVVHASNQVLLNPTGGRSLIDYTAAPIRQPDGSAMGCVLVFRDITEKQQLLQELSWQAGHDALTGLSNRAAMQEPFRQAVLQARQQQTPLAVCLLDLDHFQTINTRHGNAIGDHLLQEVAQRLTAFADDTHAVARLGGDEFMLLLRGLKNQAAVEAALQQLLERLAAPYCKDHSTHATASIGVAMHPLGAPGNPQADPTLDTLLRQAAQAMYQAKQNGRNRVQLFDVQHDQEVQTDLHQRARIAQALHDGELRLYYQPKVNMRTGTVFGMEALLRWQHPERGVVGPFHFLTLVENTDLIIDIGEWVLVTALQQMQQWARQGLYWRVSVNIAARQFQQTGFVERLAAVLQQFSDVSPSLLELEILESAALDDVQYMRQVMAACQQLGVHFALDDFGTGYSSLSYLKRLPVNTLKIDQSFVRDMLDDADDLTLVDAIVGLAKAFDRQVVAEGVETVEHGLLLLQLGCDLAQGYGIAWPMPADAVAGWAAQYLPAEAWRTWGVAQWEQADFPLLLAEHEYRGWVAHIATQNPSRSAVPPAPGTAAADTVSTAVDTRYPGGFEHWYNRRGAALYGHLPAFTALGPVLQRLRQHGLDLLHTYGSGQPLPAPDVMAGLHELQHLQKGLSAALAALLSVAAAEKTRHSDTLQLS